MTSDHDRSILRELAKRHSEAAADPVNDSRRNRIRDMHALKPGRPVVWIDEIPWHEMDIGDRLTLRCQDERARSMELYFRRCAYRWQYIQADMVLEDTYYITKAYHETPLGIEVAEKTLTTDSRNNIISHHYEDLLDTDKKLDRLTLPILTAQPERDADELEFAREILDGIMPVALRGHGIYCAPWDVIARYRGVEPILFDMLDRPEFIHRLRARFQDIYVSRFEQMEALGLLDYNVPQLHCTPPYTDELPARDYIGGTVRLRDIWFRGMAQLFSSVSPAMQDEFDIEYQRPLMNRCGLSYYGCCEPLDRVIPYLKTIPNLRKVGVTPWADIRSCAEQLGGGYVMARKPNPALVGGDLNAEAVAAETAETAELCLEYGCPCELVLKDISTVGYKPQNLIEWNRVVQATLDRYW